MPYLSIYAEEIGPFKGEMTNNGCENFLWLELEKGNGHVKFAAKNIKAFYCL